MGERGNRSRRHRDEDNEERSHKRRSTVNSETSGEGELVQYRILCPDTVIGSVIGKGGKVINSIRHETRAKVKIFDPFPGSDKRVISVFCFVKERDRDIDEYKMEINPICPAQDALIRVHDAIVDSLANAGDLDIKKGKIESCILVPASQASNVIGKSGSVIKRIRSNSRAGIKVSPKDPDEINHSCAMSFDNFVQITGESETVKRALFSISSIMYKFPAKEQIPLEPSVSDLPPSVIIPSDVPIYPAGGFYSGPEPSILPPPRTGLPILPPAELTAFGDATSLPVYPSIIGGFNGPARSEELVVRVLCPYNKIGRVIGKGGATVKNIRHNTGARIDVDDTKNETDDCLITITSTELMGGIKSVAVEAVLLLQGKINDEEEEIVTIRLLVPTKIIGCLIGKGGSIVNEMRKKTRADIRISKGTKPKRVSSNDELVEVCGEVVSVRDALIQIVLRLREEALRDREESQFPPHKETITIPIPGSGSNNSIPIPPMDSLYAPSSLSLPSLMPGLVPSSAPLSYDQRAFESDRAGLYGYGSFQAGDSGYGSLSSYSSKGYLGVHPYVEMVIPANALSKVLGKGGLNLDNIRKISGAHIDIMDSSSSHFERIAQISGTPEQKQSAENLIKAFILST